MTPFQSKLATTALALLAAAYLPAAVAAQPPAGDTASGFTHFDPKGKPPSSHTIEVLDQARKALPFNDTRDFDEMKRGFIAPLELRQIQADSGHIAWDMDQFNFIDKQERFDSVHPSLHRIAKLNQGYGLYEVIPGIYQVRGLEIAEVTFIRGKTGWIVYDVNTNAETARAAWQLLTLAEIMVDSRGSGGSV